MSLERELRNFEEADDRTVRHEIYCPSCKKQTQIIRSTSELVGNGIILCEHCERQFVYKLLTTYKILTATVNEFNDNQL